MFERIQEKLTRVKQRGKIQLKKRVNITTPGHISIYVKKSVTLSIEQFKNIKSDLTQIFSTTPISPMKVIFLVTPNKPVTSKGILIRMGKGKGKIVSFCRKIPQGTVCILLYGGSNPNFGSFFKKYPFFAIKKN